jgi:hypothetical protein
MEIILKRIVNGKTVDVKLKVVDGIVHIPEGDYLIIDKTIKEIYK